MTKSFEGLIITENRLIDGIGNYFERYGFSVIRKAINTERGIDLELFKNGVTLYIEAKGSVRNLADMDNSISAMKPKSVRSSVKNQIIKLMEREEHKDYKDDAFYLAAWPETPVYREQVNRKARALARLGYLHLWLQEDLSVEIEGPLPSKQELLQLLKSK